MTHILIILADGFEDIEAISIIDILRRANVQVTTASISDLTVTSAHQIQIQADTLLSDIDPLRFDGLVLPGGEPASTTLKNNHTVLEYVQTFHNSNKLVAAICAAPTVLAKAGILSGQQATCYPGYESELAPATVTNSIVEISNNIITSRGPATAMLFAYAILDYLGYTRESKALQDGMLMSFLLQKNKL